VYRDRCTYNIYRHKNSGYFLIVQIKQILKDGSTLNCIQNARNHTFVIFCCIIFVAVVCFAEVDADLCKSPTEQDFKMSLQQGVVPRGIVNAGDYTYDHSANSVIKCVASCCLSSTCEVHYSTMSYLP